MHIRPAEAHELAAVGELTVAAYAADGHIGREHTYADELRAAERRAAHADLVVAVADDGTLLGTVTFCLYGSKWAEVSRPGEAEFRMLAVAPEARGAGVGGALTKWCIDRARGQGCTAIALCTLATMVGARRIYERMGFVRVPDRDWWPTPEIELLAYILEPA